MCDRTIEPDAPTAAQVVNPEVLHRHECLLRWADVDPLGHVNNVAYATYLQEAHQALLRRRHEPAPDDTGCDTAQRQALRYEVTFLAPLMLAASSVLVESRVSTHPGEHIAIVSEVSHESLGHRQLAARAKALFGTRVSSETRAPHAIARRHHATLQVRRSDVDVDGRLSDVTCFEYLQEARIQLIAELGIAPTATVVAQKDVDLFRVLAPATQGVDVWSWVSRVGNRSTTIESMIMSGDDEVAHGSVTLVFFSPQLQKSVSPSPDTLAALRSRVPSPPS
jgi:acyl-CoA thioester hydrolase